MTEQIIQDWLAETSALSPVELSDIASSLNLSNDLNDALFTFFENHSELQDLIDPICRHLFNYYRSRHDDLKYFTLQFLPNLIYIYLNAVASVDKKRYRSVETLLIGIYNLEVVDELGQPTFISFRLPSLAQASIYHEPMSLAHASLTESALRRLEECNTKLISWGPHPQVETLNAQNRLKTITGLIFVYNRNIGSLNKKSLLHFCKIASRLVTQGFGTSTETKRDSDPKSEGSQTETLSRIPLSPQLLIELLCGLYYAMYNDFGHVAMEAVADIYNRSCYECYANVLVVANAIKNSSKISSQGQAEGTMGISVALSPATNTVTTVNKFMITNASFRTKKLPDDIPIISKDETGSGADVAKPLTSISEEKEDKGLSVRGTSLRGRDAVTKNLQKLGIGKKFKDKDGKLLSKATLSTGSDKKQASASATPTTTTATATNAKDKARSSVVQNGDFVQEDGSSPLSLSKKKAMENGPTSEGANGSAGEVVDGQMATDSSVISSSKDEAVSVFNSSKNVEEKPFMQVSSV